MSLRIAVVGDITAQIRGETAVPTGAAAIAIALAELGAAVTLRGACGSDAAGEAVLTALERHGIATDLVDRLEGPTMCIREDHDAGATYAPGAVLHKGARMDIYALFRHDAVILDAADQPLRRFLSDLPAHTVPDVRLLGTLRHLDGQPPSADELEIAMRFDVIVGTGPQLMALTGGRDPGDALERIRCRMPGTHLRAAVAVLPDAVAVIGRNHDAFCAGSRSPSLALPLVIARAALLMAARQPMTRLADAQGHLAR